MAGWEAKSVKKNCEDCEKLDNPDSFAKGVRAKIAGVFDCENCVVTEHLPIQENENIVILYNSLPQNYEGHTGIRIISTADIRFVLEIFSVPEELWDDYYQKILYFHLQYTNTFMAEQKVKREADAWKKKGTRKFGSRRRA